MKVFLGHFFILKITVKTINNLISNNTINKLTICKLSEKTLHVYKNQLTCMLTKRNTRLNQY